MIKTTQILFLSHEYFAALALRQEVLRTPLGLNILAENLLADQANVHLAAFQGQTLCATLLLSCIPEAKNTLAMKQVAVSPQVRRLGYGRELVKYAEQIAKDRNISTIILNARSHAIPFYLALGYEICSPPFIEVGIEHCKMQKKLCP